jgi:CHAT domain-containing protein
MSNKTSNELDVRVDRLELNKRAHLMGKTKEQVGCQRAKKSMMAASIAIMFTTHATGPQAQVLPAPSSASNCQAAMALAVQAAKALSARDVIVYEESALAKCKSEVGEDHPNTLNSMNNLAISYRVIGQNDKALELNEQTLKLRRSKLGEDHLATLNSMNNLANSYSDVGQNDKALALREQTLKLIRANLGEDHPYTLSSMNNLAASYRAVGQNDKALELNEQTLKLRRSKLGEDHLATLNSMSNLATSFGDTGQNDKALALREQTLKLMRAKLGEDHPRTLDSMNNLANSYSAVGQNDKALALREQTLKLMRAKLGEDHPDTLSSMNNLANSYSAVGQNDKALALYEQTLKLKRAKLGEDHPDTLDSMNSLALSYGNIGQNDKALALNEQTLKLMQAKLGEDHPNTLSLMNNLANSYSAVGQNDKALALREQTLKLRRAKLGEDHPDTLSTMNNLANSYSAVGQNDKALALREQTLKLMRAKLGEDHPNTLSSMNNLAASYRAVGQNDKALAFWEQALKLRRAKLGEDHPDTLGSMNNLAITYRDVGRISRAAELIPLLKKGLEKQRSQPGFDAEQRQSLFIETLSRYQRYATFYVEGGNPAAGFDLADLSKGRSLADIIAEQSAVRSLSSNSQTQLLAAQATVTSARAQIEKYAQSPKPEATRLIELQKALEEKELAYQQLDAKLKEANPRYAALTSYSAATTQDAAKILGAGEVFVSVLMREGGFAQAFLIDQSGNPKWFDLKTIKNHEKTVAAFRELISPSSLTNSQGKLVGLKDGGFEWVKAGSPWPKAAIQAEGQSATATNEAALALLNQYWYDTLIKPIAEIAAPYARWIISPDKDLALLPFDTLPLTDPSTAAAGAKFQTLGEAKQITLVQSFSVLKLLKAREAEYAKLPRSKELFAMGNAVYAEGWKEAALPNSPNTKRNALKLVQAAEYAPDVSLSNAAESYALSKLQWNNLPGTGREIAAISSVFKGNQGAKASTSTTNIVDSYTGLAASEGNLQKLNASGSLKDYRYMLFSAHGYLAQNPAQSALVLSQKGNSEGIDGYVSASEWPLYDIRSDLTVLSACDTGVGSTKSGEGVMGLPYALFVAGNKNTLLTLWPVDDAATAEFMSRFFTKLKAGTAQPEALTQTKREFMKHPQWSAPQYWAAFVLYGV